MKDKEKQIQEMAKDIENTILGLGIYLCNKSAEKLYNAGYRKLPENSVVLTREEYQKDFSSQFNKGYKIGGKETTNKIFNTIIQVLDERKERVKAFYGVAESVGVDIAIRTTKELAKQFGVEIKG